MHFFVITPHEHSPDLERKERGCSAVVVHLIHEVFGGKVVNTPEWGYSHYQCELSCVSIVGKVSITTFAGDMKGAKVVTRKHVNRRNESSDISSAFKTGLALPLNSRMVEKVKSFM